MAAYFIFKEKNSAEQEVQILSMDLPSLRGAASPGTTGADDAPADRTVLPAHHGKNGDQQECGRAIHLGMADRIRRPDHQ